MKIKPIYVFDNMYSTGLDQVPVEAIILVKDDGHGEVSQYIKQTNVGVTSATKIIDVVSNSNILTLVSSSVNTLSELDDVIPLDQGVTENQILMWDRNIGNWRPADLPVTQEINGYLTKINDGYVILDTDKSNKGHAGKDSVDLSISTYGANKGAIGEKSVALGADSAASGTDSVAIGHGTKAVRDGSTAIGSFNEGVEADSVLEIGIGTGEADRKTGLSVKANGTVVAKNATTANISSNEKALTTKEYVDQITAASGTLLSLDNIGDVSASGAVAGDSIFFNDATGNWEHGQPESNIVIPKDNGYVVAPLVTPEKGSIGQDSIDVSKTTTAGKGATGSHAFSAGDNTEASGSGSTSFGAATIASGDNSVSSGLATEASGENATATGNTTKATGADSFAAGAGTESAGARSVAIGNGNKTSVDDATVLGSFANDTADIALNVGIGTDSANRKDGFTVMKNGTIVAPELVLTPSSTNKTLANKEYVDSRTSTAAGHLIIKDDGFIVEGMDTSKKGTTGEKSIDLSDATTGTVRGPTGLNSLSEGLNTTASGDYSHSEGNNTEASGFAAHADGNQSLARGRFANASGDNTEALGEASNAMNHHTEADGFASTSIGSNTRATADASFAGGLGTISQYDNATVVGQYNDPTGTITIFQVGIGTEDANRKNGLNIELNGVVSSPEATTADIGMNPKALITKEFMESAIAALNLSFASTDLTDTNLAGRNDFDVIMWDATNGVWIPSSMIDFAARGLIVVRNLNDIQNVDIVYAEDNDALVWDNSDRKWKNKNLDLIVNNNLVKAGLGYRIADFPTAHKAPTGDYALDLSYSQSGSNLGASGSYSFAIGNETAARQEGAFAEGLHTVAEEYASHAEGNHSIASGNTAHAEGNYTHAEGIASHSSGDHTVASGNYSNASGKDTIASGESSSANGRSTISSGTNSFAVGIFSQATANSAFASGNGSIASGANSSAFGKTAKSVGSNSFAIGQLTEANGVESFAGGNSSVAGGIGSLAFGNLSTAAANYSIAIGENASATAINAISIGNNTTAVGESSVALGDNTTAEGQGSFAEGSSTTAHGANSHAEGALTSANGIASHSEGANTVSSGDFSHAEGNGTDSSGTYSHAEGLDATASGSAAHAQGRATVASGDYSLATGRATVASGENSSAFGLSSHANGIGSIAAGNNSVSDGDYSFAFGSGIKSSHNNQYSIGMFNDDTNASITFSIGIGSDDSNRKNGLSVINNGMVFADTVTNGQIYAQAENSKILVTKEWANSKVALEQITENAQTGFRHNLADTANYGDIGLSAFDLSISTVASTTNGATGAYSFATNENTIASGVNSVAMVGGTASDSYSIAIGQGAEATASNSISIGHGAKTINSDSIAIGHYNVGTSTDTVLEVGIGSSGSRSNGLEIYSNGNITAPNMLKANITGNKDLTSKEYVDDTVAAEIQAYKDTVVIGDMNDVTTSGVVNNQVLVWSNGTSQWENKTATISLMSDVDTETVAPATGDTLVFDGSNWVTYTPKVEQDSDHTATDGQTDFVISNVVVSRVKVFANGERIKSTEYTISDDGTDTTVSFDTGRSSGDWVLLEYLA